MNCQGNDCPCSSGESQTSKRNDPELDKLEKDRAENTIFKINQILNAPKPKRDEDGD